jgi:hypothetical protein
MPEHQHETGLERKCRIEMSHNHTLLATETEKVQAKFDDAKIASVNANADTKTPSDPAVMDNIKPQITTAYENVHKSQAAQTVLGVCQPVETPEPTASLPVSLNPSAAILTNSLDSQTPLPSLKSEMEPEIDTKGKAEFNPPSEPTSEQRESSKTDSNAQIPSTDSVPDSKSKEAHLSLDLGQPESGRDETGASSAGRKYHQTLESRGVHRPKNKYGKRQPGPFVHKPFTMYMKKAQPTTPTNCGTVETHDTSTTVSLSIPTPSIAKTSKTDLLQDVQSDSGTPANSAATTRYELPQQPPVARTFAPTSTSTSTHPPFVASEPQSKNPPPNQTLNPLLTPSLSHTSTSTPTSTPTRPATSPGNAIPTPAPTSAPDAQPSLQQRRDGKEGGKNGETEPKAKEEVKSKTTGIEPLMRTGYQAKVFEPQPRKQPEEEGEKEDAASSARGEQELQDSFNPYKPYNQGSLGSMYSRFESKLKTSFTIAEAENEDDQKADQEEGLSIFEAYKRATQLFSQRSQFAEDVPRPTLTSALRELEEESVEYVPKPIPPSSHLPHP